MSNDLDAQQPKPLKPAELDGFLTEFYASVEGDGADGEDEPLTERDRRLIRGAIEGLLADPEWDALWGRHIDWLVSQRAQQPQSEAREPVAWMYIWPDQLSPELHKDRLSEAARDARASRGVIERPLIYGNAAPPSGQREGMLRAAEIAKSKHDALVEFGAKDLAAMAAAIYTAIRAEAEKLPQTHVMVPVEIIKGFVERYGDGIEVHLWLSLHKSTLEAMLRAAQEGKS